MPWALRINRWLIKLYLMTWLQTLTVFVVAFVFSRTIGQFFLLSNEYQLKDIGLYVLGILPGEMGMLLPFLMMLSLLAFVLKMHFNGYDHAMQTIGFGFWRFYRLLGGLALMVFLMMSALTGEFGKTAYQHAKFVKMQKQGLKVQVWQKIGRDFYQLGYNPFTQRIENFKHIAYQLQPEIDMFNDLALVFKQGVWQDKDGKIYDFEPPELFIHQLFGVNWLSWQQLYGLEYKLGLNALIARLFLVLRDAIEILLFCALLLVSTRANKRHSLWQKALKGSAVIVSFQFFIGNQGAIMIMPLVGMVLLIKWIRSMV